MKEFKKIISLINYVKEEKVRFIISSVLIFLCGLGDIFYGYLNGTAVEAITSLNIKKALIFLGIYAAIEFFLEGILNNIARSNLERVESKLTRKLSLEAYKKALVLPAETYEKHQSGEIINRINYDADTLSFLFGRLLRIFTSLVVTIVIFFYILANSWIIALEIIIIVSLLLVLLKIYNPKMKKAHKDRKTEGDKLASLTTESIRGIREIKTLGIRNNLITDAKDICKLIFDKSLVENYVYVKFVLLTKFLRITLEIGTFVSCVFLMYYGKISLAFFIAMTYYIYRYTYLIEEIDDFTKEYQRVKVSIDRVSELLENKLASDDQFGKVALKNAKGVVEFKNVYFDYPDRKNMLKDFNLKLEPGKKIAIVGASGQGKSTLFNILTRLFDIRKGTVTLDNISLKDLDEESLRDNISVIRQEPFVFNRTVLDNFKVLNKDITLKEVRKYCKLAYIDDYIMSLPEKYNTLLGEGGVNLSGGQKQRLAIARTLSKNSKVILFDEATSALDNSSQEYIKKTIDNLTKDHTIVIVAHRLSTIVDADIIHVVDNGQIVATGKHTDLLENNSIYRNLYLNDNL